MIGRRVIGRRVMRRTVKGRTVKGRRVRGRRVPLVLACAVLAVTAVSCDDDTIRFEGGVGPVDTPSTFVIEGDGDTPGSTAPDGAPGAGRPGGGTGSAGTGGTSEGGSTEGTTGGNGSSGGGGEQGGGSGEEPATGAAPPEPEPIEIDDRGRVGDMATVLLGRDITQASIEIDATDGEALTGQARSALQSQLAEHGSKSVSLVDGNTVPEQDVYTTASLRSIMESHRSNWSTPDRVGVYVMVLSGRHEDEGVVGVSFNATGFAIFSERLRGGLLGLNYATYEEAVTVHELGHLFGLVNLTGHGAFHEDPSHKKHSANSGSVMYWAVESTVVGEVFTGGPPRDFDADDEQEMAAIRQS